MKSVSTRNRLGFSITVDQCERCGGIWFDRGELLSIDRKESEVVDDFDLEKLQEPLPINEIQKCPRCSRKLVLFLDPTLPHEVLILRCPLCEGIWLNCGELKKFQKLRFQKKTTLTDKEIDRLANTILKKEESPYINLAKKIKSTNNFLMANTSSSMGFARILRLLLKI